MPKPDQVENNVAKWILRIMVGGFITLGVMMLTFILTTWYKGNTAKIRDLELGGVVTSIRQPDTHDTKWFVASLSDGKSIVLEDEMLGVLQLGDSLFKKKGENYYSLKKPRIRTVTRVRIIQP